MSRRRGSDTGAQPGPGGGAPSSQGQGQAEDRTGRAADADPDADQRDGPTRAAGPLSSRNTLPRCSTPQLRAEAIFNVRSRTSHAFST